MKRSDRFRPVPAPGIAAALGSALLFGATTPLAKAILAGASPLLVAGLLYLGSGVGLTMLRLAQDRGWTAIGLGRADCLWLGAATVAGGVVAPALLMMGLAQADAAAASLLLNLEVVFTAVLAWWVFREPTSMRVVLGLFVIVIGGVILVWPNRLVAGSSWPLLSIAAACLCWGLDNNITRKISTSDARVTAAIKGLAAGATNTVLALACGAAAPPATAVAGSLLLGFLGYGLSLVLFIVALRQLGTARTGAYFATAPFIGVGVAMALYGHAAGATFWLAASCMGAGVWLHLSEHHEHEHVHPQLTHTHPHKHDEHHRHEHGFEWDGAEPHTHEHLHRPLRHAHAHFPDIHHQHGHPRE